MQAFEPGALMPPAPKPRGVVLGERLKADRSPENIAAFGSLTLDEVREAAAWHGQEAKRCEMIADACRQQADRLRAEEAQQGGAR
jgi:hypothetical protein